MIYYCWGEHTWTCPPLNYMFQQDVFKDIEITEQEWIFKHSTQYFNPCFYTLLQYKVTTKAVFILLTHCRKETCTNCTMYIYVSIFNIYICTMGLNKQKRLFTISQSAFLLYDQKKLSKKMCLSTWYTRIVKHIKCTGKSIFFLWNN